MDAHSRAGVDASALPTESEVGSEYQDPMEDAMEERPGGLAGSAAMKDETGGSPDPVPAESDEGLGKEDFGQRYESMGSVVGLTAEQEEALHDNLVVLRVEQTGSLEAKAFELLYWTFMTLIIALSIVVLALSAEDYTEDRVVILEVPSYNSTTQTNQTETITIPNIPSKSWYVVQLILACVFLIMVLLCGAFFVYRVVGTLKGKKYWRKRQVTMATDASVILVLIVIDLGLLIGSYSVFIWADCLPSVTAITLTGMFTSLCVIGILFWMTMGSKLMAISALDRSRKPPIVSALYRCFGIKRVKMMEEMLDMFTHSVEDPQDPDRILVADLPWKAIARRHFVFISLYGILLLAIILSACLGLGLGDSSDDQLPPLDPTCAEPGSFSCSLTSDDLASAIFNAVAVVVLFVIYNTATKTAWRQQKDLPNTHFKLSKILIRIQMRYGRMLFVSVFFGSVLVQLASLGTCRGVIDTQLGSVTPHLSIALYSLTMCLLYAPAAVNDSFTQEVFQTIAWTEDDVEGEKAIRRMNLDRLTASPNPLSPAKYIAKQIGVPDTFGVFSSPMEAIFCTEYLVKLFYWTRAAYKGIEQGPPEDREDPTQEYPYSIERALSLFHMTDFECFYEEVTDTYAIMGSGNGSIVLAFRGTASTMNIMTDLKAWSMPYPPHPRLTCTDIFGDSAEETFIASLFSAPVKVHTGFYRAWSGEGFNARVIDAVVAAAHKMESASPGSPVKIFVTGHSLGGALACLAALELKAALPDSKLCVYTFGAPRVGNQAFGMYANQLVPDYWHIVRTEDPVARIPKGISYKRSGQRVILGSNGNLSVHPSHFEVSLFSTVGGKVSDHMLAKYGLSIGEFLKAQVRREYLIAVFGVLLAYFGHKMDPSLSLPQFVPSLSILRASKGVQRLAKKVDLEGTLLVRDLRGQSLRDRNLKLRPVVNAEKIKRKTNGEGDASSGGCGCGSMYSMCAGKSKTKGDDEDEDGDE